MMGGAAVATGADEATAFMNPAGITRIPGRSFSFSTSAVTLSRRSIGDPLDPSGALGISDSDVARVRLRLVPNTFCLFLDGPPKDRTSGRSRHKYAFCAATTEREQLSFTRNALLGRAVDDLTGAAHSTSMRFVQSTMALSWGLELTRSTSIGVNFRTENARFDDFTSASAYRSEQGAGQLHTIDVARDAWSWDTSLLLGLTSHLSRVVTLGAALKTPSQHLFGKYRGVSTVAAPADGTALVTQDRGDFRYNHPGSLRLGLAFSWPRLTFEVDGSFYGPQAERARASFDRTQFRRDEAGQAALSSRRASLLERGAPVTNVALGMEYFLRRNFALVAGVNSDFSGLGKLGNRPAEQTFFRQRKDSLHAGLGVSSYRQNGSLLLGVKGRYSWGEALIADPGSERAAYVALDQAEWATSLVLSGRINFRTVRDAALRAASPLMKSSPHETAGEGSQSSESGRGSCPVVCSAHEACIEQRCVEMCRHGCRAGSYCSASGECEPLPEPEEPILTEQERQALAGRSSADSNAILFADLAGIVGYGARLGAEWGKRDSFILRASALNTGILSQAAYEDNEQQKFGWGLGASAGYRRYEAPYGSLRGFYVGGGLGYALARIENRGPLDIAQLQHSVAPYGEFGYRWVFRHFAIGFGPTMALRYPVATSIAGKDHNECGVSTMCRETNSRRFEGTVHLELGWFR